MYRQKNTHKSECFLLWEQVKHHNYILKIINKILIDLKNYTRRLAIACRILFI